MNFHKTKEAIMTNKIPEGFHTVTPYLTLENAAKSIEQYKKGLGAQEVYRMETPDGKKIMHACIQVGDSKIFLGDTNPEMGCGTPSVSSFYLYMDDVDASFKKATQAGLTEVSAPQDMFWGDRTGTVKDSNGIQWTLATHVRDVSQDEMEEAKKKWGKAA